MKIALVFLLAFSFSSAMAFDLNLIPHCPETSSDIPEEFYGRYLVKNKLNHDEAVVVSDKGVEQVTTIFRAQINSEENRRRGDRPSIILVPIKEEIFLKSNACKTYTLKHSKDDNTTTLVATIHATDVDFTGISKVMEMFHLRLNHDSKVFEYKASNRALEIAWFVLPLGSFELGKFHTAVKVY